MNHTASHSIDNDVLFYKMYCRGLFPVWLILIVLCAVSSRLSIKMCLQNCRNWSSPQIASSVYKSFRYAPFLFPDSENDVELPFNGQHTSPQNNFSLFS